MSARAQEWLLEVLNPDGSVDQRTELPLAGLEIGRQGSGLVFSEDTEMADRHARLVVSSAGVEVIDSGQGSGVWLRLRGSDGRALTEGDQVWLGSQVLVIAKQGECWQLRHHGADGQLVEAHDVPDAGLFIGRESELVLDKADRRLSRRHAQLVVAKDGRLRLYDRGAHNGTYLKLKAPEVFDEGSEFRLATQRIRLVHQSMGSVASKSDSPGVEKPRRVSLARRLRALDSLPDPAVDLSQSAEAVPSASPGAADSDLAPTGENDHAASEGAKIVHSPGPGALRDATEPIAPASTQHEAGTRSTGSWLREGVLLVLDSEAGSVALEVEAGQTVLEAVQGAGLERGDPVDWECGDGGCGVCVMEVLEGANRLDPPDPTSCEMKTIQIAEQLVPDPRKYRLACLARIRGTVRLRKLT